MDGSERGPMATGSEDEAGATGGSNAAAIARSIDGGLGASEYSIDVSMRAGVGVSSIGAYGGGSGVDAVSAASSAGSAGAGKEIGTATGSCAGAGGGGADRSFAFGSTGGRLGAEGGRIDDASPDRRASRIATARSTSAFDFGSSRVNRSDSPG